MFLHLSVSHSVYSRHGGAGLQPGGRESTPGRGFCIQDGGEVGQIPSILWDTVNMQAVLILLEFILVLKYVDLRCTKIRNKELQSIKIQYSIPTNACTELRESKQFSRHAERQQASRFCTRGKSEDTRKQEVLSGLAIENRVISGPTKRTDILQKNGKKTYVCRSKRCVLEGPRTSPFCWQQLVTLPSHPPPTGQVTGGNALPPCYVTARVLSGSAVHRTLTGGWLILAAVDWALVPAVGLSASGSFPGSEAGMSRTGRRRRSVGTV